jgi:hypothetical protein
MTYLTQQVRLLDTAPQLLIQKAFEPVIFTDSDDTLKSWGLTRTPLPDRYVQHLNISGQKQVKLNFMDFPKTF